MREQRPADPQHGPVPARAEPFLDPRLPLLGEPAIVGKRAGLGQRAGPVGHGRLQLDLPARAPRQIAQQRTEARLGRTVEVAAVGGEAQLDLGPLRPCDRRGRARAGLGQGGVRRWGGGWRCRFGHRAREGGRHRARRRRSDRRRIVRLGGHAFGRRAEEGVGADPLRVRGRTHLGRRRDGTVRTVPSRGTDRLQVGRGRRVRGGEIRRTRRRRWHAARPGPRRGLRRIRIVRGAQHGDGGSGARQRGAGAIVAWWPGEQPQGHPRLADGELTVPDGGDGRGRDARAGETGAHRFRAGAGEAVRGERVAHGLGLRPDMADRLGEQEAVGGHGGEQPVEGGRRRRRRRRAAERERDLADGDLGDDAVADGDRQRLLGEQGQPRPGPGGCGRGPTEERDRERSPPSSARPCHAAATPSPGRRAVSAGRGYRVVKTGRGANEKPARGAGSTTR